MRQKWFSVLGDEPEQSEEEQDSLKVSLTLESNAGLVLKVCSYMYSVVAKMVCVLDSVLSGLDQALVEFIMLCSDLCSSRSTWCSFYVRSDVHICIAFHVVLHFMFHIELFPFVFHLVFHIAFHIVRVSFCVPCGALPDGTKSGITKSETWNTR